MIPPTEDEKTNGIATARPGMRLYDEAWVKALELKAAQFDALQAAPVTTIAAAPDPLKTTLKVEKRENISASELEDLLNAGWEKWHAEYKGNNLNVVLTRRVAIEPAPEPEKKAEAEPEQPKPTIKTVGPTLIIEPPVEPPPPVVIETEAVPSEPVVAPANVFEQYRAESNARIFAAAEAGYSSIAGGIHPLRPLLGVSHVRT